MKNPRFSEEETEGNIFFEMEPDMNFDVVLKVNKKYCKMKMPENFCHNKHYKRMINEFCLLVANILRKEN